MPETIEDLRKQMADTFEGLKAAVEQKEDEIEEYGEALAETEQKVERIHDEMDELDRKIQRMDSVPGGGDRSTDEPSEEHKAFLSWARKGMDGVEPEEQKTLRLADDTQSGVLASEEMAEGIIEDLVEVSPVREFATVRTIGSRALEKWRKTQHTAAQWVGETESRPDTQDPAYGKLRVPAHELFAKSQVSNQMLEDSDFDLESDLREDWMEQFRQAEGAAFIDGNGTNKPQGILQTTSASGGTDAIEEISGGGSSALDQDDPFELKFALKEGYLQNSRYFLNSTTLKAIRELKDNDNQYLFAPLAADEEPTLAGLPYTLMEDLPNPGSSNNKAIICGDMARGYIVADRLNMTVQRDPYTKADDGAVVFRARRRVGGHVHNPEALKVLTIG